LYVIDYIETIISTYASSYIVVLEAIGAGLSSLPYGLQHHRDRSLRQLPAGDLRTDQSAPLLAVPRLTCT